MPGIASAHGMPAGTPKTPENATSGLPPSAYANTTSATVLAPSATTESPQPNSIRRTSGDRRASLIAARRSGCRRTWVPLMRLAALRQRLGAGPQLGDRDYVEHWRRHDIALGAVRG